MDTILVVSKTRLPLKKGEYIDIFLATKKLKKKYDLFYDTECRLKRIICNLNGHNISVFSTGTIMVRSRDLVDNEKEIQVFINDLKKFIHKMT